MSIALLIDDREAWLEARRSVITATDIAAISGIHPYKSARLVFEEKKGLGTEKEPSEFMILGQKLEPVIAELFSERTGIEIEKGDFVIHPEVSFFGCTPDYLSKDGEAVIECKWAGINSAQNFGEPGTDSVPDQYVCQVMWQMIVTGRRMGYLAALLGTGKFYVYEIPFNERLAASLIQKAQEFWSTYILSECPPPISGQPCDTAYLNAKHPEGIDATVMATSDFDEIATRLGQVKKAKDALEVQQSELENQLKEFMADASTLITQEGRFTWKNQARKKTDWEALVKDAEIPKELIDKHTVEVSSRIFRNPFKGGRA